MLKRMTRCLLLLVPMLCGCTYVRVCDERGFPVTEARITYSQWSLIGEFDAGTTDDDGDLTLWPKIPSIESITATKQGYRSAVVHAQNRDVIYIILSKDGDTPRFFQTPIPKGAELFPTPP